MILSSEQERALTAFKLKKNILLTGPGGSGKSALIKEMVQYALEHEKSVQVCALTGCAAVLLKCEGATTIHSWAGIGLATGSSQNVVERAIKNKIKRQNWSKVDILIIDEVSMMSKKVFDIIDRIGRIIKRKQTIPFGGIQVIFSGDFYQLPPVGDTDEIETTQFCFESDKWRETIDTIVNLTTIFRQTDEDYSKILNQIRVGKLYKSSYDKLMTRVNQTYPENGLKPTKLYPKRTDVDRINTDELAKLTTPSVEFTMQTVEEPGTSTGQNKSKFTAEQQTFEINYLMNNTMADKKLTLKIGAQVMCVANIDLEGTSPIVNGSQGIVIEMSDGLPLVQFIGGYKRIIGRHSWKSEKIPSLSISQIPLILAWAITIHKAQGGTLDLAQIDAGSNIFECGQTYVALSRIKTLSGLYLTAFDPNKIKVNKKVQEYYKQVETKEVETKEVEPVLVV